MKAKLIAKALIALLMISVMIPSLVHATNWFKTPASGMLQWLVVEVCWR
jgi:hypothetical protein